MRILPLSSQKDIDRWHHVPKSIYSTDPNWIPHLRQDVEKVFDKEKNKLYDGGKSERWLLLDQSGTPVGRLAAFVNPKTSYSFDQPTGGIGFFECPDDKAMAFALFDTAKEWLLSEGMEAMDGPINFGDKNQFWGLQVQNFESIPSYAMNYNPPYYRALFEEYGFQTYYEQYVFWRDIRQAVEPVFIKKAERVLETLDVRIADVRGRSSEQIAHDFRTVYNAAWGGHDNFKEMSEKAALKVAKALKPVMDKRIIVFAYHGDKAIGFYVNIPELNEIFRHVDGDLNWLGKLKFLYHKWKGTPRTMVGIVFGVSRAWQGKGIEGAMITWFGQNVVPLDRYDDTIMTWIGDFNPKMIKVVNNLGTTLHRTFITYRYLFDREKPFVRCPIVE